MAFKEVVRIFPHSESWHRKRAKEIIEKSKDLLNVFNDTADEYGFDELSRTDRYRFFHDNSLRQELTGPQKLVRVYLFKMLKKITCHLDEARDAISRTKGPDRGKVFEELVLLYIQVWELGYLCDLNKAKNAAHNVGSDDVVTRWLNHLDALENGAFECDE